MSVNVQIIGRLGADAEIKQGKNGQLVSFRMATDDFRGGQKETVWFNITDYSERGLKMAQYLKKGRLIHVNGSETVSIYYNKNNEPQVSRDIKAFNIDFISTGQSGNTQTTSSDNMPNVTPTTTHIGTPKMDCGALKPPMVSSTVASEPIDELPF